MGSRLNTALAQPVTSGIDAIPGLVLEALEPMFNEISVDDIIVQESKHINMVDCVIHYHILNTIGGPVQATVIFPVG